METGKSSSIATVTPSYPPDLSTTPVQRGTKARRRNRIILRKRNRGLVHSSRQTYTERIRPRQQIKSTECFSIGTAARAWKRESQVSQQYA